ncbi:predicted protein [Nematostella vectensis]|uniref:Uncharacterized protein n=1 Tax=Nematostella vectensis TaxID=45351 RepID=A7S1P1_NEMVE|nr:predicted protein [Nematostella vectensis]|eukprot:XP_001634460.1 predicted protein [Nematostella vectensis]
MEALHRQHEKQGHFTLAWSIAGKNRSDFALVDPEVLSPYFDGIEESEELSRVRRECIMSDHRPLEFHKVPRVSARELKDERDDYCYKVPKLNHSDVADILPYCYYMASYVPQRKVSDFWCYIFGLAKPTDVFPNDKTGLLDRPGNKLISQKEVNQVVNEYLAKLSSRKRKNILQAPVGSREWWRHIDNLSQRRRSSAKVSLDEQSLVELNDYFANLCWDTAYEQPTLVEVHSEDHAPVISERYVWQCLQHLKNTATGPDLIPSWIWKEHAEIFTSIICKIWNWSLESSVWPSSWKRAHVTPLPKVDVPKGKTEDAFRLKKIVNVEKKVDIKKGFRYLLELELAEQQSGRTVRLSEFVYKYNEKYISENPNTTRSLCYPEGFQWSQSPTVYLILPGHLESPKVYLILPGKSSRKSQGISFCRVSHLESPKVYLILPVQNYGFWIKYLVDRLSHIYTHTPEKNFHLVMVDFNTTDIDIDAYLQKSALNRRHVY